MTHGVWPLGPCVTKATKAIRAVRQSDVSSAPEADTLPFKWCQVTSAGKAAMGRRCSPGSDALHRPLRTDPPILSDA